MILITGIKGFRCTNHKTSKRKTLARKFNIDNYCANTKIEGKPKSASYYVEHNCWEFPFIAETSCKNYSLIWKNNQAGFDFDPFNMVKYTHTAQTYKASSFNKRYQEYWSPIQNFRLHGIDPKIV